MPPPPRRVWITRTQPQAAATAERVRAMGLQALVAPVLEARPVVGAEIDLAGVDALAFTSGHAVRAFTALSPTRGLPVFAVGDATAALARDAGFDPVLAAAGGAKALAKAIAAASPKPVLVFHPTLAEPAADLSQLLVGTGVNVRTAMVYDTVDAGLTDAPDDADTILIHSAKAAVLVTRLLTPDQAASLDVFAISPAAAAPLAALPFRSIATAPFPNEADLLHLLDS